MMNKDKNTKKLKRGSVLLKIIIVSLLFLIAAVSIVGFTSLSKYQQMKLKVEIDTIYNNIFINDVHVGGLTKEEALEKLNLTFAEEFSGKSVAIFAGSEQISISYSDINARKDISEAVKEAYDYARTGFVFARYADVSALSEKPFKIYKDPACTYDADIVTRKIAELAHKTDYPAIDATISRVDGVFVVTDHIVGKKLDEIKTEQMVFDILDAQESSTVQAVIYDIAPKYTRQEYENAQSLIGSGRSVFANIPGRNENIMTAANKINNYVVYPGEVFSTNRAFGDMTAENGYHLASVIVGGKLVDDLGGGVCQVSSTLYNALLNAELKIVERQNHSMKVSYMDYGFDATLAGDYIDLKFENDTNYPIFIEAFVEHPNTLIVNIYGYEVHNPTRQLVFHNLLVETVPAPADIVKQDLTLPKGERSVISDAKLGYRYELYKTIYENGVEIGKELVNKSYYKPVAAEIAIGSGE